MSSDFQLNKSFAIISSVLIFCIGSFEIYFPAFILTLNSSVAKLEFIPIIEVFSVLLSVMYNFPFLPIFLLISGIIMLASFFSIITTIIKGAIVNKKRLIFPKIAAIYSFVLFIVFTIICIRNIIGKSLVAIIIFFLFSLSLYIMRMLIISSLFVSSSYSK